MENPPRVLLAQDTDYNRSDRQLEKQKQTKKNVHRDPGRKGLAHYCAHSAFAGIAEVETEAQESPKVTQTHRPKSYLTADPGGLLLGSAVSGRDSSQDNNSLLRNSSSPPVRSAASSLCARTPVSPTAASSNIEELS